jgi:hypothetical protein
LEKTGLRKGSYRLSAISCQFSVFGGSLNLERYRCSVDFKLELVEAALEAPALSSTPEDEGGKVQGGEG